LSENALRAINLRADKVNERDQVMEPYKPAEIAALVESAGVGKVRQDADKTFLLAVLAGAFISFGALFFTFVTTGSTLGFRPTRLLGGVAVSLSLILMIIGGGIFVALVHWAVYLRGNSH
jgi:formate/nitrite transporter FocA (FNT family)